MYGDLCGLVSPATPGGRRYFLLLVDDTTRYMWAVLLDSKAVATDATKRQQAAMEKEYGRKLWVLSTDNGGEFTVAEYITTTTAATQALWLSRMLTELLGKKVDVVELKVDSKSALALAKNPVFHEKSKHI